MNLTKTQTEVMDIIRERNIRGVCINYVWRWLDCRTGRTINAGTVKALERGGLIEMTYFSGGRAAVNLTPKARG